LPGLGPKGDVVDWAAAGGTADMLRDLVETDARPWVRSNDHNVDDGTPVFVSRGPTIYMAAGQLENLVNETEAAVIAAERGLYQRGGQIVRIGEAQLLGADEKPTTSLVIQEQDEHTLVEDASASAIFMKYDERSEDWRVANPTSLIIRAWQGRATRLRLPLLSGAISTPLILKSGRIIERPGYDEGTGFYFEPAGTIFPPVPTAPTKDDVLAALRVLSELIAEFPFVDEASRSVAISGMLTAVSRRAMDFAFLHGITAPAYGSGKSYLVDLFCMLATGRTAPVIPQPKAPEEFEKRLDAQLLRGVSHIAIDNIDKPLEEDKLCQILTQRFVEIRPLNSS
jgi:putative DNA primase/helicase